MKQKTAIKIGLVVASFVFIGVMLLMNFTDKETESNTLSNVSSVEEAKTALSRYCGDTSNFDQTGSNVDGASTSVACVERGCDSIGALWVDWKDVEPGSTTPKQQKCYDLWNSYVYAFNYPPGSVGPNPAEPPRPGDSPIAKLEAPAPVQPPSEEYKKWGPAINCQGTLYPNSCNEFKAKCNRGSTVLIESGDITKCQAAGYTYGDSISETDSDNPVLRSDGDEDDSSGLAKCDDKSENCCGDVATSIIGCPDNVEGGESVIFWLLKWVLRIMTAGVGIAAVGGVAYGALLYTTAESKPEQTKKAIGIITNVVIGIVAYALMAVFLNFLIPGGIFS